MKKNQKTILSIPSVELDRTLQIKRLTTKTQVNDIHKLLGAFLDMQSTKKGGFFAGYCKVLTKLLIEKSDDILKELMDSKDDPEEKYHVCVGLYNTIVSVYPFFKFEYVTAVHNKLIPK